jgi:hypothetical protein
MRQTPRNSITLQFGHPPSRTHGFFLSATALGRYAWRYSNEQGKQQTETNQGFGTRIRSDALADRITAGGITVRRLGGIDAPLAMRCIFCKNASDNSVSVEHIIPESLGNVAHIWPKGWVCDSCNNYIAREVEKPFLDSPYGKTIRFEMAVANKRGRIPTIKGLHPQSRTVLDVTYSPSDNALIFDSPHPKEKERCFQSIEQMKGGTLYLPTASMPTNDIATARFIGKIALEILAYRCLNVASTNEEIVNQKELDELRRYVRQGQPKIEWPVHIRKIYPADFQFPSLRHGPHQVLHECMILAVKSEYYAVIAIFGIEYTINLGGPELDGFHRWLETNGSRSPLSDSQSSD